LAEDVLPEQRAENLHEVMGAVNRKGEQISFFLFFQADIE
jgi:hypothetical protein